MSVKNEGKDREDWGDLGQPTPEPPRIRRIKFRMPAWQTIINLAFLAVLGLFAGDKIERASSPLPVSEPSSAIQSLTLRLINVEGHAEYASYSVEEIVERMQIFEKKYRSLYRQVNQEITYEVVEDLPRGWHEYNLVLPGGR